MTDAKKASIVVDALSGGLTLKNWLGQTARLTAEQIASVAAMVYRQSSSDYVVTLEKLTVFRRHCYRPMIVACTHHVARPGFKPALEPRNSYLVCQYCGDVRG